MSFLDKLFEKRLGSPPEQLFAAVYKNDVTGIDAILKSETFGQETLYLALEQAVNSNYPKVVERLVHEADAAAHNSALLAKACLDNNKVIVDLLIPASNIDDALKSLDQARYRSGRIERAKALLEQRKTVSSRPPKI